MPSSVNWEWKIPLRRQFAGHADTSEYDARLLLEFRSFARAQKLLAYAPTLPAARLVQLLQLEALIQEQQQQYANAKS